MRIDIYFQTPAGSKLGRKTSKRNIVPEVRNNRLVSAQMPLR